MAASPHPTAAGGRLELLDVTKRYGDAVVVDNISLAVASGEFVAFLGPSGSGKTTTLNMVAGFADASDGEISLDGESLMALPPHRRHLGMVFQHYALFPHLTVRENVAFPLRRRKVAKQRITERVDAMLERVGLSELGERLPRQLSGGQQQRVAVARGIIFHPRVLLMDEPLGALDKRLREDLQLELKRIHREMGITFVYVTHDQDEALSLADRIAVFNKGRLEQVGPGEQLYERPRTRFVAEFLGDSNVFAGEIVAREGAAVVLRSGDLNLTCGETVVSEGSAAAVMRPESIRILDGEAPPPDHNLMHGTVTGVLSLGASRKVHVTLDNHTACLVREPRGRFRDVAVGRPVSLACAIDDTRAVFDNEVSFDQTENAGDRRKDP